MSFYAYMMTNKHRTTLYCGQTDDLNRRVWEHRNHVVPGFTDRYNCEFLVWYEVFDTREEAVARERQIKNWKRIWKDELIEKSNPDRRDLSDTLL